MLVSVVALGILTLLLLLYYVKIVIDWAIRTYFIHIIPGPPKTNIVIGNLALYNKTQAGIFDIVREWNSKYYPIYCLWIFHIATANLLTPEDLEIVLADIKHEKKGKIYLLLSSWLKTGLLTSEGEKWQLRRKILTPSFHFSILQDFVKVFNEETKSLVEELQTETGKSSTNIVSYINQFTLKSIAESSMGTKLDFRSKKQKEYKEAVYDIVQVYIYRMFRPWLFLPISYMFTASFFKEWRLVNILHGFTKEVIEEREKNFQKSDNKKRRAMLDLLLSAKSEGLIDDEGIREEVDTFMFEGHDTTAVAIGFILMLIACHKDVQEKIIEEMREVMGDIRKTPTFADLQNFRYLERCIKESLRLYPSVWFISRYLGSDVVTATGYKLKKDSMVVLHIYGLHHNEEIYPEPEKFDPDRFLPENCQKRHPFAYVPFSAGPRNCIGQKFALLELKTVVSGILANFVLEPVDTPETIVLIADIVLRTEDGIRVKFVSRSV